VLHLALTGNIASGKSTVAELFRSWGAFVIDADQIVRELQQPGSPVLDAIAVRFGPEVLLAGGELDRARVREIVMRDPAARADLNAIVHPAVHRRRAELLAEAERRKDRVVVSDIPLLFEAADPGAFDAVILVDAPEPVRLARLMEARGLSRNEARRMLAAQMPTSEKRDWIGGTPPRGPFIIENDGDLTTLEEAAREVWEKVTGRPHNSA
jgi:dephospho-CoA kinase